MYYMVTK